MKAILPISLTILLLVTPKSFSANCISKLMGKSTAVERSLDEEPFRPVVPKPKGLKGLMAAGIEQTLWWPYVKDAIAEAARESRAEQEPSQRASRFLTELLSEVDITYIKTGNVDPFTRKINVPKTGPTLVFANHPYGFTDVTMVAEAMLEVRPDVRIWSNSALKTMVPKEMADKLITIDLDAKAAKKKAQKERAMKEARDFMADGGMVVIFPAGAVGENVWVDEERFRLDPRWRQGISEQMEGIENLTVIPMYIPGENSWLFYKTAGMTRQILFPMETYLKRGSTQELVVGPPVKPDAISIFDDSRKGHIAKAAFFRLLSYSLVTMVENQNVKGFEKIYRFFVSDSPNRSSLIREAIVSRFLKRDDIRLTTPFDSDIEALLKSIVSIEELNIILAELGLSAVESSVAE